MKQTEPQHLRVCHVVPTYLPATRYGGPIYAVHGLCKALAVRGHEVSVFTTNVDGAGNSDVPLNQAVELDGVKVWYFHSKTLRRLYFAPNLASALKSRVRLFDVLHLHSVFLWPTWAAARIAEKNKVPYLMAPRGMLVPELIESKSRWLKSAWINLVERKSISAAAGIHVTAPLEEQEIRKFGFRLPPIYYVPNGLELNSNSDTPDMARRAANEHTPYVLFLSRINWKKGLDRLVRAWRMVPNMKLLVAGNDEESYWKKVAKLADAEGVSDRIEYVGSVHGENKWRLYKNAELFVLPSYSENFGTVVLEAMAMGCPVMVTPEVGLAPVVHDSGSGRVVPGDPADLARAINELLADPELRQAMGDRGRSAVETQFMWDSVARQMEVVYSDIIDGRIDT